MNVSTCYNVQTVNLSTYCTNDGKVLFKDLPLNYKITPSLCCNKLKNLNETEITDCESYFYDFIESKGGVVGINTVKRCDNTYYSFIVLMDCSFIEMTIYPSDDKNYKYLIMNSRYTLDIKLSYSSKALLGLFIKNYNKEDIFADYIELIKLFDTSVVLKHEFSNGLIAITNNSKIIMVFNNKKLTVDSYNYSLNNIEIELLQKIIELADDLMTARDLIDLALDQLRLL